MNYNNSYEYVDYVEVEYDKNGNLDMNNAIYIDSINGKRELSIQESYKYF